jgi:autoinducer 2-degrading protein
MTPYTIIVEFVVGAPHVRAFRDLIVANATTSLADEPGCTRFDVLTPEGRENTIVLYEVYTSKSAFEHHSASPHYHAFAKASAHMVASKTVTVLELLAPHGH